MHELSVEVFDSKNNSVLDDVYRLSTGGEISQTKSVKSLYLGFEVWNCTRKFSLGDTFVKTYHTNIQPWNTYQSVDLPIRATPFCMRALFESSF